MRLLILLCEFIQWVRVFILRRIVMADFKRLNDAIAKANTDFDLLSSAVDVAVALPAADQAAIDSAAGAVEQLDAKMVSKTNSLPKA